MTTRKILPLQTYLLDSLMPDLAGHDRRPSAFPVYLCLRRHTHGSGRRHHETSPQTIASDTGIGKRTVQGAIAHLQRRRLLGLERIAATAIHRYVVHRPWRGDGSVGAMP